MITITPRWMAGSRLVRSNVPPPFGSSVGCEENLFFYVRLRHVLHRRSLHLGPSAPEVVLECSWSGSESSLR